MKKRAVIIVAFFLMLLSLNIGYAELPSKTKIDNIPSGKIYINPDAEQMLELEKHIIESRIKAKQVALRDAGAGEDVKVEWLSTSYKWTGGYAGNQPPNGTRFQTGGAFFWSDNGGPSASTSISLSLPKPFNAVSVSINLGNSSSSGVMVNVPDTTNYYKLYIYKKLYIQPFAVYTRNTSTGPWRLINVSAARSVDAYSYTAFRVNFN